MSNYDAERTYFKEFKNKVTPDDLNEYKSGIQALLEKYNTAIHSNRFIVGAIVKIFTFALWQSTQAQPSKITYNYETPNNGLVLPNNKMLFIKSRFSASKTQIRLVNTMGDSNPKWTVATLFVLSQTGIVYGDPDMVKIGDLSNAKDALILKQSAINRFISIDKNVVNIDIPVNSSNKLSPAERHEMNMHEAREIMRQKNLGRLLKELPK